MTTGRFVAVLAYSATVILVALPRASDQQPELPVPEPQLPTPLRLAVEVLRDADMFAAAQVGYAGITPPEVLAWRIVLRDEHADSVFRTLLTTSDGPGLLYALAGLRFLADLRKTDLDAFHASVRQLTARRELVRKAVGCIISHVPLGELALEVDRGLWTREFLAGRLLGEH